MEVRGEAGKKPSRPVPSAGVHRSLILGALWGVNDTGEWNPGDLCNFTQSSIGCGPPPRVGHF